MEEMLAQMMRSMNFGDMEGMHGLMGEFLGAQGGKMRGGPITSDMPPRERAVKYVELLNPYDKTAMLMHESAKWTAMMSARFSEEALMKCTADDLERLAASCGLAEMCVNGHWADVRYAFVHDPTGEGYGELLKFAVCTPYFGVRDVPPIWNEIDEDEVSPPQGEPAYLFVMKTGPIKLLSYLLNDPETSRGVQACVLARHLAKKLREISAIAMTGKDDMLRQLADMCVDRLENGPTKSKKRRKKKKKRAAGGAQPAEGPGSAPEGTGGDEGAEEEEEGGGDEEIVRECHVCGATEGRLKLCGRCKALYYCSRECQREDWAVHKSSCTG